MFRYLVYLCPFLANMMQGGMFFITVYRFAESGAPPWLTTCTLAVWALVYALANLALPWVLRRGASPLFLIYLSAIVFFITSVGAIVLPSLNMQYVWLFTLGIAAALYCSTFQIFCNSLEHGTSGGLVHSTSIYTASWSVGLATGPFLFGVLKHWQTGYMVNAVLSLVILAILYSVSAWDKRRRMTAPQTESTPKNAPTVTEFKDKPDLIRVAWIGLFIGVMTVSLSRTLGPARAVELALGQFHAGMILATLSYVQALTALLLYFSRRWMYRSYAYILFALAGGVGMTLSGFGTTAATLYLASVCYGVFSGSFYFLSMFHSLVKPEKQNAYTPYSEAIGGAASVFSPCLAGVFAGKFSIAAVFYGGAVLMLICLVLQGVMVYQANSKRLQE